MESQSRIQPTFLANPWLITDENDERVLPVLPVRPAAYRRDSAGFMSLNKTPGARRGTFRAPSGNAQGRVANDTRPLSVSCASLDDCASVRLHDGNRDDRDGSRITGSGSFFGIPTPHGRGPCFPIQSKPHAAAKSHAVRRPVEELVIRVATLRKWLRDRLLDQVTSSLDLPL